MAERSLDERAMQRLVPQPVPGHTPPPRELGDGLWELDRHLRHFGAARLPSRTTLVRLPQGSLAVISPPALVDDAAVAAIASIGRVEFVVVPNSFHYLYARDFMTHCPGARLLLAPGLRERVPALDGEELGAEPPPAWAGALEYEVLGPVRGVSEVLFFHPPSGALILTDLAFNMQRYPRRGDRVFWRMSGIPAGFGPGRTTRTLLLRDRAEAERALRRALEWPIRRVVVAHGDILEEDAPAALRRAFSL